MKRAKTNWGQVNYVQAGSTSGSGLEFGNL